MQRYTWRLPGKISAFNMIGCLILLYPLLELGNNTVRDIGQFQNLNYYYNELIPFLSLILFAVFSLFLARTHKFVCFFPVAAYAFCTIYAQLDSELSYVFGSTNGVPISTWLPAYLPELTNNGIQITLLLASLILALLCYLDKIPSFIGGILFILSAVAYLSQDIQNSMRAFNPVRFEPDAFMNAFYNLSSIAALIGFALCLFAFRRRRPEPAQSEPRHFSFKELRKKYTAPRSSVSYGFDPSEQDGSDQ